MFIVPVFSANRQYQWKNDKRFSINVKVIKCQFRNNNSNHKKKINPLTRVSSLQFPNKPNEKKRTKFPIEASYINRHGFYSCPYSDNKKDKLLSSIDQAPPPPMPYDPTEIKTKLFCHLIWKIRVS